MTTITKKIKDGKYEYTGHVGRKNVNFPHTIGHVVAQGLRFDEARLIGVRIYNRYNGRYDILSTRTAGTDNFTLTIQLPNTMRASYAKNMVETIRNSVPLYRETIKPFIFVTKK